MLSIIIKLISFLVVISVFSGCGTKDYSYSYTTDKGFYKKVPQQKIRNSKAMHRATMRPYVIAGKKYYPTLAHVGDRFSGIASWYGPNFHAKKTSNGEIYDMYAMTAAHKTLPMNTMVKVVNQENGKSTIVRINDRGPFVTGRIIDLSNSAAHAIDMVDKGIAKVKIEILGFNAKIATTQEEKEAVASAAKFYVQVGAFERYEGAVTTKRKFNVAMDGKYKAVIKKGTYERDGKVRAINRVWVSGFRSQDEAGDFKEEYQIPGAMIIAE